MQEGPGRGVCVVLTFVTLIYWLGALNASSVPHILPISVHHMVVTSFKGTKNLEKFKPHHY